MSTNYIGPGQSMNFTAPSGGVTAGVPVFIGGLIVIPASSASAGAAFVGQVGGLWTLTKITAETWSEGQAVFWDYTNSKASTDSSSGLPIGSVAVAATSSDTTGIVKLNGVTLAGRVLTMRKRFTIAQVNAGATLLPATAGAKFRQVDSFAIAVGGAVGAVTTVDILATQSASSVKLVAFAQASLTQNTLLRAGASGASILAGGVSFAANDVGTAVTVNKTGSDVTTATHIDVTFNYVIE